MSSRRGEVSTGIFGIAFSSSNLIFNRSLPFVGDPGPPVLVAGTGRTGKKKSNPFPGVPPTPYSSLIYWNTVHVLINIWLIVLRISWVGVLNRLCKSFFLPKLTKPLPFSLIIKHRPSFFFSFFVWKSTSLVREPAI